MSEWHYCVCGAAYRSVRVAMQCCSDRWNDPDDPFTGPRVVDPNVEPAGEVVSA